jgi:ABC-type phosphate/phosphonate transport system substrate-binding protein
MALGDRRVGRRAGQAVVGFAAVSGETHGTPGLLTTRWLPRLGWSLVALSFLLFAWGLHHRAGLEASGDDVIRMLFVPSVEQGTLVRRGDELARFIRGDSGLSIRSAVPTSYAAVIQALGTGQADVAWVPAFAYALANDRYGVQARLQVVRSVDLYAIVVARVGRGAPARLEELAGRRVAVPSSFGKELRARLVQRLDHAAPGWIEVSVPSNLDAVRMLVEKPDAIDAAASSHVFSGPNDLIGDGRKELEYHRPGTMNDTAVIDTTDEPIAEQVTVYYGCILTRTDSGVRRLEDFAGLPFAFSDETSTSGHIFARVLLERNHVTLGHVYFAGGHPNVVQAVADGKAAGGATFYSPPSEREIHDRTLVGDARRLILKRMQDENDRLKLISDIRIVALTDPIPNDVCCVRKDFPRRTWDRFEASLQKFLQTPEGRSAYHDLVAGVAAAPTDDQSFDGFRKALRAAGVSATQILDAEESKLKGKAAGSQK